MKRLLSLLGLSAGLLFSRSTTQTIPATDLLYIQRLFERVGNPDANLTDLARREKFYAASLHLTPSEASLLQTLATEFRSTLDRGSCGESLR